MTTTVTGATVTGTLWHSLQVQALWLPPAAAAGDSDNFTVTAGGGATAPAATVATSGTADAVSQSRPPQQVSRTAAQSTMTAMR
jgi:hypothetical protein